MWKLGALVLVIACSDKSGGKQPAPPAAADRCTTAVDKLVALMARRGYERDDKQRLGAIEECRKKPGDPLVGCFLAATDDAALDKCMEPEPKGEPIDQLDAAAQNLRTYFFVHETFTDQNIALTPATPCCQFPAKKCPAETAPNEYLTGVLKLDLSIDRSFQYRFESTGKTAVIEAVGDRGCTGKVETYRRELELRDDGNMHITILDPH